MVAEKTSWGMVDEEAGQWLDELVEVILQQVGSQVRLQSGWYGWVAHSTIEEPHMRDD